MTAQHMDVLDHRFGQIPTDEAFSGTWAKLPKI